MKNSSENTKDEGVFIMGGGPAGLTTAYELSKKGMSSTVFEKDTVVGGIARTANYKGYLFDIGGHRFFTKIDSVNAIWQEVMEDDFLKRSRLSRIYYNKKFFFYPLKPLNALQGLGLWNSFMIINSYLYAHLFPSKEEETFEQWVTNRFGKRLFNTFFKTYTEKVWGISCNEIRAEWAAQRIKGLSLIKAIRNSFIQNNNSGDKKKVIKTLIDSFDYPRVGPGLMWEKMKNTIEDKGSQVRMETEVVALQWENNRIVALEVEKEGKRETIEGNHFVSTLPIRELVQKLRPAPPENILEAAGGLNYRDFLTVALVVDEKELFPDNWIYIHEPDVKLGRIQNYKNWSPHMVPDEEKSCLGLEYFCFEGDELWEMADEDLIKLGTKELASLGLVPADKVIDGAVVRMPKAYPVYDSQYKEHLNAIREFLDGIENLQLIGRNGMHRYNNMDHSMVTGIYAAENITGANHDIWEVNEEQEYHEEKVEEGADQEEVPDEVIIRAFNRMDKLGFAVAIGAVSGLGLFLATVFLILKGGDTVGPNLARLNQFFFGYTVTWSGAFVGLFHSFFWGFLFGWLFAYLRNLSLAFYIYQVKRRIEMLSFRDFLDHF